MRIRPGFLVAALALSGAAAHADTLHFEGGITVDGKVRITQEGLYEVDAGGNLVYFRPEEVLEHEKNDKDGRLDMEQVKRESEARQAQLTQETGLTLEQRERVDELLNRIRSGTPAEILDAKDQLVKMNQDEVSIIRYLHYWFNNLVTPELLEAMAFLNTSEFFEELQLAVEHANGACRAKAIELLAKTGRKELSPLLARGLVDHKPEVQLSAIYAMAALGEKTASPALVELSDHVDLKVSNASKQALEIIWKSELGGNPAPLNTADWASFVKQRTPSGTFKLEDLKPLIAPEQEFIYG
jgi:hypothetical protein